VCRKKLPKVPESLLKKRKQREEAKTKALKAAEVNKKVCALLHEVLWVAKLMSILDCSF
jgi:hypothetical protein